MLRHLTRPFGVPVLFALLPLALPPAARPQDFGQDFNGTIPLQPFEAAAVQALLENPDGLGRREAARELARRGTMAAVQYLARSAAFDPARDVRIEAGDAIARIRRRVGEGWAVGAPRPANFPQLVDSWYRLYLNRPAELQGMRDQIARLRRGDTPEEIQAGILGSDEYFRLQGSRRHAWVAALYTDVLGRSPSRREVITWVETLERNGGSRERTALEFLRGARRELSERQP